MNSINWPAPSVWVCIAQLVDDSANAEATVSNPVEATKTFFGFLVINVKQRLHVTNGDHQGQYICNGVFLSLTQHTQFKFSKIRQC